jgi:hypothetical protein
MLCEFLLTYNWAWKLSGKIMEKATLLPLQKLMNAAFYFTLAKPADSRFRRK